MKYIEFNPTRKFDVTMLGRIAVDLNPEDYYKPLSECTTFKKYVGGSPANIAVGLSRLGKKCGFFARVSDDQFGDYVTNFMQAEGVDISHIKRCEHGEKIGLTFTEILSPQESSILMYRNKIADLQLNMTDIDETYIRESKALLISGTSLSESPSREAALKALFLAKKTQTPVIFDIDYRNYNWQSHEEMGVYYPIIASHADIIFGSREEYDLTEQILAPHKTDLETAEYWHQKGAKIVVIKHGKDGSTAYTNDGQNFSIKPFPAKVLKGFGGGDGYASAFLYGLLEGWDIIDCLEFGSASASLLISSHSCSSSMPSVEKIKEYIADCKKKYGEMIARV